MIEFLIVIIALLLVVIYRQHRMTMDFAAAIETQSIFIKVLVEEDPESAIVLDVKKQYRKVYSKG